MDETYTSKEMRILQLVNDFGVVKLEHVVNLLELSKNSAFKTAYKLKYHGFIDFEDYTLRSLHKKNNNEYQILTVFDILCEIKPIIKYFISANHPYTAIVLTNNDHIMHLAYAAAEDRYTFNQFVNLNNDCEKLIIATDKLSPWKDAVPKVPTRFYCNKKLYLINSKLEFIEDYLIPKPQQ